MAKRKMTREEALAWKARWEFVNAAEREELRTASPEHKLRQLAALMASVEPLGLTRALREGEGEVRARWVHLKESYGV